jgi:hypothetical protein
MLSFHKTLLAAIMMMMMLGETSARMASSSSEQQQLTARKLQACTANCGSCSGGNAEVTFLDFLDLEIFDMFWQGIVICLPLAIAELADSINLGTCCKSGRGGLQGRPYETEEGPLK